ncbi:hypothetical protein [Lacrimispora saccharolytica]|uniref:hypothetical protein n=1 Tax=Lacrimispora saccharolytica TaxID=84030 RepID=UPI00265D06F9|nr:hypothetical protein [Lacrimispora saccharolytica]MCF2656632.1 hypothetical protein [Lacrimispora saccharolytica]
MLIETERLIITEFTMDMAQVVQENSVDEDKDQRKLVLFFTLNYVLTGDAFRDI